MTRTTLEYETRTPRSTRHWLIAMGCLLLAMVALLWLQPVAVHWFRFTLPLISAHRQCLTYTKPAGTVAYEEDRAASAKRGDQFLSILWPKCATHGLQFDSSGVQVEFLRNAHTYVFLHARSAVGGQSRLVYVGVDSTFSLRQINGNSITFPGQDQVLRWIVIQPETLSSAAAVLAAGTYADLRFSSIMPCPVRIYVGQADPSDSAHFVIPYRASEGTFAIDGRLQANDQLTFSRRGALFSDGPMP